MDCFRPNPNDLTVRAVCKGYQSAKSLEVKCEGPFIRLCSRKGEVLESVRLDSVRWTPCALPGGQDHCLSLQYKEPQVTEIFLKAKSRKAVAQLAARLDKAARHLPPKQPSPSAQTVHVTAHPPSEPEDPPAAPHAPSQCTNCRNLARLIDEHEAQTIELDSVYSELTELKAELQALRDKNSQLSSQFDAAEGKAAALMLAEQAAKRRAEELEKCLAEAAERCEKLLQELQAVAQAADKSTAACRGLQSRLAEANEEKAVSFEHTLYFKLINKLIYCYSQLRLD